MDEVQDGSLKVETLLRELEGRVPPGIRRYNRYSNRSCTLGRSVLPSPTTGSQQGIEVQRIAIFKHEGSLQFMGQFPDIARPAITQKTTPSRL